MGNKRQRGVVSTYKDRRSLFLHWGKRRLSTLAGIEGDRARDCAPAQNGNHFFTRFFQLESAMHPNAVLRLQLISSR